MLRDQHGSGEEELHEPTSKLMHSNSNIYFFRLLDLPIHILDDIVLALHQMINYDGYLCDLRLVNRQFNKCILHCLAFRTHPRNLYVPMHQFNSQCFPLRKCKACGICSTVYARIILQGRIISLQEKDIRRWKFYRSLSEAWTMLEGDLRDSASSYQVTRSQLEDTSLAKHDPSNPILQNCVLRFFCDAVIMLFQVTRRGMPHYLRQEVEVYSRGSKFWLRSLACYSGDAELLHRYGLDEVNRNDASERSANELRDLLAITATRGHESLLQSMLTRIPLQQTDLTFVLTGACYSGNTRIFDAVLAAIPGDQVSVVCLGSLTELCRCWRLDPGYTIVAQEMLNRCVGIIDISLLNSILMIQVDLGAAQIVRSLLSHFRGRTLWPLQSTWRSQWYPLWNACMNGDLECVRSLTQNGYLASARSQQDAAFLGYECVEVAAHANSLPICQEIYQALGWDIGNLSIWRLAAMDGSIDLISRKIAADPDLLNTTAKHWDFAGEPTVGQAGLRSAAVRLRVENVRFFLEKGFRSDDNESWAEFKIEWRYRRTHEQQYQQVQKLLRNYGSLELEVVL